MPVRRSPPADPSDDIVTGRCPAHRGSVVAMSGNVDLLKRAMELYDRGDLGAFVDQYTEDAVLLTPDGCAQGRDAIHKQWSQEQISFPDRTHTIDTIVEHGNSVATEFTWVATNTGPWILPDGTQLPPTGKQLTIKGMVLTTMREGKMAEQRMYWDNLDALQQAGLLPAPANH
jgi:predicted ester cyclase